MAKVYVSSTIADMAEERDAVLDWLRLARHQAVDSYVPDSGTVRDSCLDDVASCDLLVLIAGHRYGSQAAGGDPAGLSITHQEFRRAGDCNIPRVALLRTSIPDVALSDLGNPQQLALVLEFRKEVARSVRPAEFADLEGLIRGLSTGVQHELDKLAERKEPLAGQAAAGRVLRLAPRPLFLAGREGLLAGLDARLTVAGDAGPRVVALCGLGGAGKTSVAVEYAHRHLDDVDVVWQFPAEDAEVLRAEFARFAAHLGAGDAGGGRDPVASVHGILAGHGAGWLLVFDNAPDQASVQAFLPPAGPGRVLITSQYQHWPAGQALQVPVLGREVAAQFLVTRTGDTDRWAAEDLAGKLGGLPLALEQAAAYIQATGTTVAGYLALFRDREADLLARGEVAGRRHVAATFGLALSRLEGEAPAAAGLLRLLACLAPEPVPLALLLAGSQAAGDLAPDVTAAIGPLLDDAVAAGDAVAALRRYSLVTLAGGGLVLVHRLVQAVTLAQLPEHVAGQWKRAAAALVEAAIPAQTRPPAAWPACAVLLPHARAVLGLTSGGMRRIAQYLGSSGSWLAARDLWQLIAGACRDDDACGPGHPITLAARDGLAFWTGRAGDAAGGRDQLAALLPIRERVLGPEHPDTLITRASLAYFTGEAGDAAGARDQYAALLLVRERVLGAEDLGTLITRHQLSRWTGEAGDAAGARDLCAELLPLQEKVLGAGDPDTLITRASLARWTGRAGDAAGARDQFAELLPLQEQILGPEHPDTLTTRDNLAYVTGEAGDAAAARDQYAALLPVRERILGPEHPDTLATRDNLSRWSSQARD